MRTVAELMNACARCGDLVGRYRPTRFRRYLRRIECWSGGDSKYWCRDCQRETAAHIRYHLRLKYGTGHE